MLLAHLIQVLLLMALAGVLSRGWHRLAWTWVAYVGAVLTCGVLMSFWPDTFWRNDFWRVSRDLYVVLKVGIALELLVRVTAAFPRVAARARTLALALLVTAVLVFVSTDWSRGFEGYAAWHVRANALTLWLLALTALLAHYHLLPVHPWHRAILGGMAAHLLLFTVILSFLRTYGYSAGRYGAAGFGDALLACWWAWTAWSPERARVTVGGEVRA